MGKKIKKKKQFKQRPVEDMPIADIPTVLDYVDFSSDVKTLLANKKIKMIENPPVKMSAIILDYAKPLLDTADNIRDERKVIEMAITCWNMSLLKKNEREEAIKSVLNSKHMSKKAIEDMHSIMQYFIDRKYKYYPNIDTMIVDYKLKDLGDSFNLSVVSFISTAKEDKAQSIWQKISQMFSTKKHKDESSPDTYIK
ncbi:MAG: hypothetical protein HQL06_08890 [Nitrospirae bacterium]|nr:hypothetical protein [Nitrospirota bacterium]